MSVVDPQFPWHLHRVNGEHKVVRNAAEKLAGLKDGWYLTPGEAVSAQQEADRAAVKAAEKLTAKVPDKPAPKDAA